MKRLPLLVVAGLLVGAGFLSARLVVEDDAPSMKRYFLGLIYRSEGAEPIGAEAAAKIQAGHMANIGRLVETGEMVLAGPFEGDDDLRGIFIYDVPSLERAEELVATDPAVVAGHLRVELRAWWGTSILANMRALSAAGALHEGHADDHDDHDDHDGDDEHAGHEHDGDGDH